MNILLEDIKKILIEYDPEGLLRIGAPGDEYDSEAEIIHRSLVCLNNKPSFNYVVELVEYVFHIRFDCDQDGKVIRNRFSWIKDDHPSSTFIAFDIHSLME